MVSAKGILTDAIRQYLSSLKDPKVLSIDFDSRNGIEIQLLWSLAEYVRCKTLHSNF